MVAKNAKKSKEEKKEGKARKRTQQAESALFVEAAENARIEARNKAFPGGVPQGMKLKVLGKIRPDVKQSLVEAQGHVARADQLIVNTVLEQHLNVRLRNQALVQLNAIQNELNESFGLNPEIPYHINEEGEILELVKEEI